MPAAAVPSDAAAVGESVEKSLRAARELLGMEIAWIAEFRSGQKVFRAVDGDGDSFGFCEGDTMPLDGTYCQRVVSGVIPEVIPDTASDARVSELEVTATAGIASYVGVPIEVGDGTVYGTLCVASHRSRGDLATADAQFLRGIAQRIAAELEERRLASFSPRSVESRDS